MKQIWILSLAVLILLCIAGCAVSPAEPYAVECDGQTFTVDPVNCTITAENGDVYSYEKDRNSINITYPNDAVYFWNYSAGIGYGGLNDDITGYVNSSVLKEVLSAEAGTGGSIEPGMLFLAAFCALVGIVNALFPYTGWYLSHGWRFRDAQPSDAALIFYRVCGVAVIIFGIVILFV